MFGLATKEDIEALFERLALRPDESTSFTELMARFDETAQGLFNDKVTTALGLIRDTLDQQRHKIEMLELRLNGADKQAQPQPTKGAKR